MTKLSGEARPMNMMTDIPPFEIKNAFKDWRAVYFQDDIRRAMIKAMTPVKAAPPPPEPKEPRPAGMRISSHAENCRTILRHLADSEDTRAGLLTAIDLTERTLQRALRDMREKGQVARSHRAGFVVYHIAPAGTDVLALPQPVAVAKTMAHPKKAPSNSKIDAVFALLSTQPAPRAAIARALGMSRSAVDDSLRLLRVQGLITWVQDPMTSIKTYKVKP
jgi:DNA-binding transcriptional ArsR family regulator